MWSAYGPLYCRNGRSRRLLFFVAIVFAGFALAVWKGRSYSHFRTLGDEFVEPVSSESD
jgi:hypothetical protein